MKQSIGVLLLLVIQSITQAQYAGNSVYNFLKLTNSARVASLGGENISLHDNDLNLPYHNPALLNELHSNNLVLNYVGYFADVKYGYVSYAHSFKNVGNFAAGIHYINYGNFQRTDEVGNQLGNFKCAEYAFNLIYSKPIDSLWTIGVNLKPVISRLDTYNSNGLLFDFGINYFNPKYLISFSFLLRNSGWQLKAYHDNEKEPIPFEALIGISKELKHAPFRFSLTYKHLEHWDLSFKNTNLPNTYSDPFTGESISENKLKKFGKNILRHTIVGIEFTPLKSFYFNIGYNFRRRLELALEDKTGFVGLTWGFGLNLKRFRISYGRASYHAAGGSNHFSLSINIKELKKN